MAPRANWKGYLKLSLVSCSVALYPASSTASRVSFNTLNRDTMNKVKRQYVDPETDEVVPDDKQVKGFAVGKNDYVLIEDDELDKIKIEATHTIDIERFVKAETVDRRYLDAPYYLAPDERFAQEAFAVIREAMRQKEVVGIGRLVLSRRERPVMIEPFHRGLMATTLRYATEVRRETAYFEDIPDMALPEDMIELAGLIIGRKTGEFEPEMFHDRYEDAILELVRSKQQGIAPPEVSVPRPANVINLMDALRKSMEAEKTITREQPGPAPVPEETRPLAKSRPRQSKAANAKAKPTKAKKATNK